MQERIRLPEGIDRLENSVFEILRRWAKSEDYLFFESYWDKFKAKGKDLTCEHVARTLIISTNTALSTGTVNPRAMVYSAFLHDVGKLDDRIPEGLLNLKRPPTPEELELIRMHSRWGYDQLISQGHYFSALSALLHHKFTKGYPNILPSPILPVEIGEKTRIAGEHCARLVSLCDCFEAARYRENCFASGYPKRLGEREVKDVLLRENADLASLIVKLSSEGIFDIGIPISEVDINYTHEKSNPPL